MKNKSLMLLAISVFAGSVSAETINVSIDKSNNIDEYRPINAKIRLTTGNDWIELGPIHPGGNNFIIESDVDNTVGSLWLEDDNLNKFVTHFKKDQNDTSFNFKIGDLYSSDKNKSDEYHSTMGYNTTSSQYIFNSNGLSLDRIAPVYQLSKSSTNSWASTCEFVLQTGEKKLSCQIFSKPAIAFMSDAIMGSGFSYAAFAGSFESYHSPEFIKGTGFNPTRFGLQSWIFYSYINFQGGPSLYYGEFRGGGIGLGAIQGNGYFL